MKEDLDRKERAVPPGIEIPGILARKKVKRAIATNSNTSVETLKKLSHDSDKSVRQLAYSGLKQKGEKPIDKPFKPAKPVEDDNPGKYLSADFDPVEFFGLDD